MQASSSNMGAVLRVYSAATDQLLSSPAVSVVCTFLKLLLFKRMSVKGRSVYITQTAKAIMALVP